jgi:hypothetical protein
MQKYYADYPWPRVSEIIERRYGRHWGAGRAWYPEFVWLGVSCEDQATADARIPLLLQTPAVVRFVSYEPALGPVNLRAMRLSKNRGLDSLSGDRFRIDGDKSSFDNLADTSRLDWVICGGESGPGARPFDLAWARSVRDQCAAANVAFFLKQLGSNPVLSVSDLHRWLAEFPDTDRVLVDNHYRLKLADKKGGDMDEWPEDLRVRQFPEAVSAQQGAFSL